MYDITHGKGCRREKNIVTLICILIKSVKDTLRVKLDRCNLIVSISKKMSSMNTTMMPRIWWTDSLILKTSKNNTSEILMDQKHTKIFKKHNYSTNYYTRTSSNKRNSRDTKQDCKVEKASYHWLQIYKKVLWKKVYNSQQFKRTRV